VAVQLTAHDGQATISVRDNGRGIAPADRPHIFDRFYKGQGVKGKGLGIGLFVSREIAERLGGSLEFDTGNWGTEFRLIVPLEARSEKRSASNGATPRADVPSSRARPG
jgi:signal transduction histidine kinase